MCLIIYWVKKEAFSLGSLEMPKENQHKLFRLAVCLLEIRGSNAEGPSSDVRQHITGLRVASTGRSADNLGTYKNPILH